MAVKNCTDLKKRNQLYSQPLLLHPRLWRVVPMYIASVPLFMLMVLMLPNGARFVCTKLLQ